MWRSCGIEGPEGVAWPWRAAGPQAKRKKQDGCVLDVCFLEGGISYLCVLSVCVASGDPVYRRGRAGSHRTGDALAETQQGHPTGREYIQHIPVSFMPVHAFLLTHNWTIWKHLCTRRPSAKWIQVFPPWFSMPNKRSAASDQSVCPVSLSVLIWPSLCRAAWPTVCCIWSFSVLTLRGTR